MTISDQLQFSVVTAPVAALDRRALSQAWYSALYGNRERAQNGVAQRPVSVPAPHEVHPVKPEGVCAPRVRSARRLLRAAIPNAPANGALERADRRAPRSVLARRIERALLFVRAAHKSSFTVETAQGRVHLIVQSRGSQLKLIAICPQQARERVTQALAQARYALAMRGIDVQADALEQAQC